MPNDSTRIVLVAIGADLGVALAKVATAVFTGSSAVAAGAAEALADTANDVFLLIAQRRSSRPADDQHPLGYGREAYFWGLIAALGAMRCAHENMRWRLVEAAGEDIRSRAPAKAQTRLRYR